METPTIKKIIERAFSYLEAGFPVHFSGPTGTGKTTLAMHIANLLKQPVMLMYGDEEFGTSDLVGDTLGYRKRKLIDNFIHSVLKTEEDVMQRWVDNRLTTAVKHGFTLIYDEFNRSRPEANNALLSVLEEKILSLPASEQEEGYIKAHPNFRAIFTSNPEEYAGVHKTQDALLDRMVTIRLDYFDRDTELKIVKGHTGVADKDAEKIVSLIRSLRKVNSVRKVVTIRPALVIGAIIKQRDIAADYSNPLFREICHDALISARSQAEVKKIAKIINKLIDAHFGRASPEAMRAARGKTKKAKPTKQTTTKKTSKLPRRDSKGKFISAKKPKGEEIKLARG